MKVIGKICVVLGFICCVAGAGLQSVEFWMVPPMIFLAGMVGTYIGMKLIDFHEQKRMRRKRKRLRHMDDVDKQQATDDMKNTYRDLIIKEIME